MPIPNPPSPTTLQTMSQWKQRSQETHEKTHIPELSRITNPITLLLLGDSFIERFKTQPKCTKLRNTTSLPSNSNTTNTNTNTNTKTVFNAGVGGDRIQNIIYRLTTLSLLSELITKQVIGHIILRMGTNNLKPKKPIPQEDYNAYRAVLVLLIISFPEARVVVTGLTRRRDVPDGFVDEFNARVEELVAELNLDEGVKEDDGDGDGRMKKVMFLPAPREIVVERHLVDHVHLNDEGYEIWYRQILEVLDCDDEVSE